MLESFPVSVFIGAMFGFLAGIGIGGGSLLLLWLTYVLGVAFEDARIINLLFFLPTALVSSFFRRKEGTIHLKTLLPAILAGCISTAIISQFAASFDHNILKKLFGVLLLAAGLREIFTKK
jgi:uncharacterized membrane protein YfcA